MNAKRENERETFVVVKWILTYLFIVETLLVFQLFLQLFNLFHLELDLKEMKIDRIYLLLGECLFTTEVELLSHGFVLGLSELLLCTIELLLECLPLSLTG